MTCTCKVQGKGEYPNTISHRVASPYILMVLVGQTIKKLIGGFMLYWYRTNKGQMSMGQKKESVMDPLHPDLPLNVFKC